jgi:hypothetical protein
MRHSHFFLQKHPKNSATELDLLSAKTNTSKKLCIFVKMILKYYYIFICYMVNKASVENFKLKYYV